MNVVLAALSSYVFGFERNFVQKFRAFNVDEIDTRVLVIILLKIEKQKMKIKSKIKKNFCHFMVGVFPQEIFISFVFPFVSLTKLSFITFIS